MPKTDYIKYKNLHVSNHNINSQSTPCLLYKMITTLQL